MRRSFLRTSWAFGLTSLLALGGTSVLGAPPAGAVGTVGFAASASASGFRSTYLLPGQVVVEEVYDFGGPVAQSRLDTTGGAGFASLPFPGAAAIVGPGLVLNLAGLSSVVPASPYPFYTSAAHPSSPESETTDPSGNYGLESRADQASAHNVAFIRGGPDAGRVGRSEARTDITQAGSTVVAKAESIAEGITFGTALTIGQAIARSTSTLEGGVVKRTASIAMNGVVANGTPIGMGDNGADTKALNDALKPTGLSVRIASQGHDGGGSSDVLEVTINHPIPGGGANTGHMVYSFGGASTNILLGSGAPSPADDSGPGPGPVASTDAPSTPATPTPATPTPATPAPATLTPALRPSALDHPAPLSGAATAPTAHRPVSGSAAVPASPSRIAFRPVAAVTDGPTPGEAASYRGLFALIALSSLALVVATATWLRRGGPTSWTTS
jgi:hypothetical protein